MRTATERSWRPRALQSISTERLRRVRLKPTPIRLLLLDLFEQQRDRALNCEEVYWLLVRAGFSWSLSSIYRNIRVLATAGVLVAAEGRVKARACATFVLPEFVRKEPR